MKSTNYYDTFIEIAEDCPTTKGKIPSEFREKKTVAQLQFEMIINHPYRYTSDDVLFSVYAKKKGILTNNKAAKEAFFEKGQACFRASALAKRYGWGIHFDTKGKIALYAAETEDYQKLKNKHSLTQTQAMRNKRKK